MTGYNYRCGACKFQRKKCLDDCPFAPYFSEEDGLDDFHTIHKVFGSKNFHIFMSRLPSNDHEGLILSLLYEARARLNDPILGCVRQILDLQKQVTVLQAQVAHLQGLQTAPDLVSNPNMTSYSTSAAATEGLSAHVAHLRELQATHDSLININMGDSSAAVADDMRNQDHITSLVPQSSAPCDDNVLSSIGDIELDDDFVQWFLLE